MSLGWRREALDWDHIEMFDTVIRRPDLIECLANGSSVRSSLHWAKQSGGGESWAVLEQDRVRPVGVYGWTKAGACWSYWADLNPIQVRELMRQTPGYVLEMVEKALAAGVPKLANYVWEGNREAVAWLRGSHCFSLDLDHRYDIGDKRFIAFHTKPVEELRRYV